MIHYTDYARTILLGSTLEEKLLHIKDLDVSQNLVEFELPSLPGRSARLEFKNEQVKFPKGNFEDVAKRGLALHFFANHELLAIEMMAAALLIYPDSSPEMLVFKKGLLKTIQDEQKHFKLYIQRMKDFGIEFGDFPLNDFFWRTMQKCKTPSQFYSAMALTFESANLDFAKYYEKLFLSVGDEQTAKIMNIVYEDEISHVALGARWLNQWKSDKDLWTYYISHLPGAMTPARAKGNHFDLESRQRAGLDEEFISSLFSYHDEFKITNRRKK
jgi:uncharacterized ferritin-like protein (DUF455 family)